MEKSKATKEQILEKLERSRQHERKLYEKIGQIDLSSEHNKNKRKKLQEKISKGVFYRNMLITQLAFEGYIMA